MGIIFCKIHGRQSFYEVCGHIDAEYRQNIYRQHHKYWLTPIYKLLVCEECWEYHKFSKSEEFSEMDIDEFIDLDDEKIKYLENEWSSIYNSLNRSCWCVKCVEEIK